MQYKKYKCGVKGIRKDFEIILRASTYFWLQIYCPLTAQHHTHSRHEMKVKEKESWSY